jgi:hypothetical protein
VEKRVNKNWAHKLRTSKCICEYGHIEQSFVEVRETAFVLGQQSVRLSTWYEWIFKKCGSKIGAHDGSSWAAVRDIWQQTVGPRTHQFSGRQTPVQSLSQLVADHAHCNVAVEWVAGGHGFKSRLFWLTFWVVFLSSSEEILDSTWS